MPEPALHRLSLMANSGQSRSQTQSPQLLDISHHSSSFITSARFLPNFPTFLSIS